MYPEIDWQISKFKLKGATPKGYWKEETAINHALDNAALILGITKVFCCISLCYSSRSFSLSHLTLLLMLSLLFSFTLPLHAFARTLMLYSHTFSLSLPLTLLHSPFLSPAHSPHNLSQSHSLCFSQPEDWYSVTLAELRNAGLPAQLTKTKLAEWLTKRYPDKKWEKVYLLRGRYAQQRRLEKAVASLFPVWSPPNTFFFFFSYFQMFLKR